MAGGQRKIRVAVVFGGRSSEHGISCLTAGSVIAAMDPARYEVVGVGIARDGRWVIASDRQQLAIEGGQLPEVSAEGTALALPFGSSEVEISESTPAALGEVDVVLPLLHGPYGEDGTLQGMLELSGIRYVGAGVFASAASMDKVHMKTLWQAAGLPVGPYVVVKDRAWRLERKRVTDDIRELGFPVFVKPARAGSSMGITKVDAEEGLADAIEAARAHDPKVIVEAAVEGREIECGVLEGIDDDPPQTSLPSEVRIGGSYDFYDFEAKYLNEDLELDIPPVLPEGVIAEIRRMAAVAFEALDCEGLARVDFFYTTAGEIVLNEINTMPGFTPASAFPKMWAATGLDYPALVDRLIQTALRRSTGLR